MEREDFYTKQETNEAFVKKESFVKGFSEAAVYESNLSTELKTNPELLKACEDRKRLIGELNNIYAKIPTLTTIDVALETAVVSPEEIEKLYTSIIDTVENDEESKRVLLYFPFELIPNAHNKSLQFFSTFYKNNWKELLRETDVREGFNIGDILEEELRKSPLAKVSKAAHLIPVLLEKNLIKKDDVLTILENETDETILESTLDTLRILVDKQYLDTADIATLEKSKKVGVRNMASMIRHDQSTLREKVDDQRLEEKSVEELFESLDLEISNIQDSISEDIESMPEARAQWLLNSKKEIILERYSQLLYKKLHNNKEELEKMLVSKDMPDERTIVFIKSLEKLLIAEPWDDTLYAALHRLKTNNTSAVKNVLLQTFQRLHSAGILNEQYVSKNELENEEVEIEKGVDRKVKNVLATIEADPLLSRSVYPAAILYGSHIKGYGKESSDTDIGVFVKEDITFDTHEKIKSTFTSALKELGIKGSVMEFWLKNNDDGSLWIKDFKNLDNSLGDSMLTSPLTANWYGDEKTLQTLQTKLLPNYLYSADKKIAGIDARKIWLRDMEHNLIQYRLMHKGYKEKNVPQGGIDSPYKYEIDGESMFYDSGFRRLATKIYLEKVFLPQLKKE